MAAGMNESVLSEEYLHLPFCLWLMAKSSAVFARGEESRLGESFVLW